jgi:MFS family permease
MTVAPQSTFGVNLRLALPVAAAFGIAFGVTVVLVTVFNYAAEPMARDLGLSRIAVSGALSAHLATLIISLPLAGALSDRFGARPVIGTSALLFGAALYWVSQVHSGAAELYLAFIMAGLAGAGASPISYARAIVHGFDRRRGLALGIALAGTGLGGILLPMLFRPVLIDSGWRDGFATLAVAVAVVGLAASMFAGSERHAVKDGTSTGLTLRAAATTQPFWMMAAAFALLAVVLSSFTAHLVAIWLALGLDPAGVPRFQAILGISTIVGRLLGGALLDIVPAKFVGAGAAVLGALGFALIAAGAQSPIAIALVAVAIGACTGTESDVVSFLTSRLFGLQAFARIYAVLGAFFMAGFAVGPLLGAVLLDWVGAHMLLGIGSAGLVGSAVLLFLIRIQLTAGDAV